MAINFATPTPKKLLDAFKKAIDEGHIVTWQYDDAGDFTHTPDQWKYRAWLRPVIYEGSQLTFNFIGRRDEKTTKALYGVYHGRFIESMLTHFDDLFSIAAATAGVTNADLLGGSKVA
jgi:hypothetical protein